MIPTPTVWAPTPFQLLGGDIEHGKSSQGGVITTVVHSSSVRTAKVMPHKFQVICVQFQWVEIRQIFCGRV